jgi:hypothetical protein
LPIFSFHLIHKESHNNTEKNRKKCVENHHFIKVKIRCRLIAASTKIALLLVELGLRSCFAMLAGESVLSALQQLIFCSLAVLQP